MSTYAVSDLHGQYRTFLKGLETIGFSDSDTLYVIFQSFMAGLDALIPIQFGTLYVITNAVMLLFALIFDRHYIGIATFINLFLLGYITQFSYAFLQTVIVDPSIFVRVICLVVGVVIICFGSAFYMRQET